MNSLQLKTLSCFFDLESPGRVRESRNCSSLPELARSALQRLFDQIGEVAGEIGKSEKEIVAWCRTDAASRRLLTISGVGPITVSMISAFVPDATLFQSGRQFAAWLGLTPKPRSSGDKVRLGGISKQGDGSIRRLLVIGATLVIRRAREDSLYGAWVSKLLECKPARVVSVALVNKTARIAWAVLARGEVYSAAATA